MRRPLPHSSKFLRSLLAATYHDEAKETAAEESQVGWFGEGRSGRSGKAEGNGLEVAGNILTGTRTRDRRRLPDQTGKGAMESYSRTLLTLSNLGQQIPAASEQR